MTGALLAALLALAPAAQAQDLTAYSQVGQALQTAQTARAESAAAALRELDKAEAAYLTLEPTLRDPQQRRNIQGTLDQARAALARTPADLQAQASYAQALLRQALYDQTLRDLVEQALTEDTEARLRQLSRDFQLNDAETAALIGAAQGGQPSLVAARLQKAAARQILRELEPWAQGQAPAQSDAYLRLTRASGWQLILADLPGSAAQSTYAVALQQLAQGQLTEAAAPIRQLSQAALRDAQELQATLQAAAPPRNAVTPPASAPSTSAASVQAPVTVRPAQATRPAATLPSASGAAAQSQPTTPAGTAQRSADDLAPIYVSLAHALAAATNRDQQAAHQHLLEANNVLEQLPAGWQDPATSELTEHLQALAGRSWLEASDIAAEIVALQALEGELLHQQTAPVTARFYNTVAHGWSGQIQALAFFVLALLLPLPFYFKFRALGHQKGEWAWIVTGIGMLVVPAFIEGLSILGSWLGDALQVPFLQAAGILSVRQSPVGHFVWWLFSMIGVLMMTVGFYQLLSLIHI